MEEKKYTKTFEFTIEDKDGSPIVTETVEFGSKENPWPKNWRKSGRAAKALIDFEQRMIERYIKVKREEV